MSDKAAAFEVCRRQFSPPLIDTPFIYQRKAADATKVVPKVKPQVIQEKGGWKTSGNTGERLINIALSEPLI